jgi:hypothetical protein
VRGFTFHTLHFQYRSHFSISGAKTRLSDPRRPFFGLVVPSRWAIEPAPRGSGDPEGREVVAVAGAGVEFVAWFADPFRIEQEASQRGVGHVEL